MSELLVSGGTPLEEMCIRDSLCPMGFRMHLPAGFPRVRVRKEATGQAGGPSAHRGGRGGITGQSQSAQRQAAGGGKIITRLFLGRV